MCVRCTMYVYCVECVFLYFCFFVFLHLRSFRSVSFRIFRIFFLCSFLQQFYAYKPRNNQFWLFTPATQTLFSFILSFCLVFSSLSAWCVNSSKSVVLLWWGFIVISVYNAYQKYGVKMKLYHNAYWQQTSNYEEGKKHSTEWRIKMRRSK